MFTLPPRPPKDYVIKDVTASLQSTSQFTPYDLPRVTQQNLAKFCSPIEYRDDEVPEKVVVEITPTILDKMVNKAKAEWVRTPGKDDFFLHDVYYKYSVPSENYDPRFRNMEKVFNRSYKYELDCIEALRLEKLIAKTNREEAEFEGAFQNLIEKQKQKEKPAIQLKSCKEEPPFWWRQEDQTKMNAIAYPTHSRAIPETGPTTYQFSYVRWQEEPNLTGYAQDDPCQRQRDMQSVGQPFKTEACCWYYNTYPPPNINFRPKKFI